MIIFTYILNPILKQEQEANLNGVFLKICPDVSSSISIY